MKVRVLGCSGAIAQGCKTTSFLVDGDMLVDAGTGVGDLSRDEMLRIDDLFLTHSHLDHIAYLPLMVDTMSTARIGRPLRVHALPETLAALRQHVFNDVIWPDFTQLPTSATPLLTFHELAIGTVRQCKGRTVEALPAVHSVPAVGYAVRGPDQGAPWWVFSGDTERNPAFWQRVNEMDVHSLVIETAFSMAERDLARLSCHLSPEVLVQELTQMALGRDYPIYITHTKPSQTDTIMDELTHLVAGEATVTGRPADLRLLRAGDEFVL